MVDGGGGSGCGGCDGGDGSGSGCGDIITITMWIITCIIFFIFHHD